MVVAIATAIVFGVLLVTPAFGIGSRLLDFIQGAPAPPEVQTFFATDDAYMDVVRAYSDEAGEVLHDRLAPVPVIASETRLVSAIESPDGPIYLWMAPTEDGRQCELLQWGDELPNGQLAVTNIASGGSQAPLKDEPVNGAGACEGPDHGGPGLWPGGVRTELRPSVTIVRVRFYDATITQVEVELEGAPSVSLPVVAVGGARFVALGTVPRDERTLAVVGRNADGTEVAREAFVSDPPRSP